MFYQLIHHDKADSSTFVAQSPDFKTKAEADNWFLEETKYRKLPSGRFWGLIDEKHIAYKEQVPSKSDQLTFEEIIAIQKEIWKREIEEKAAYDQRLADYMAKFPG